MMTAMRLILNSGVGQIILTPQSGWMITLDQLRPGQQGEIARVEGCDGIACRLREMGFVPGEAVRFVRAAPLGDPLHCIIQGSRIALRGSEAKRVCLVVPQPSAAPQNESQPSVQRSVLAENRSGNRPTLTPSSA
jgi:ferrous iron transport protein A